MALQTNILSKLTSLIEAHPTYLVDGTINKNLLAADARKYDSNLLNLLLKDTGIQKHFFTKTDAGMIFKKDVFLQFISNKEFLPDSYTMYKNKIGLGSGDASLLSENGDVVLNWPYKDTILEGGQDKEDQKRNEVFFNEVLAPDQVTRLLDDKVFVNWKRYDKNGEHDVDDLKDEDNLIIKGNNLVVLHSLKKRYAGKVKLIYIDPPYNTGNDSFGYNDNFKHSTWLTFMKNRLEIAKKLLRDDGVIFISCDGREQAYLTVLMDEIFKRENLLETFHFQVRYANKSLNERDDFQPVIEYGLAYAKNKALCKPNKPTEEYKTEKFNLDIKELAGPDRTFELNDGRKVEVFLPKSYSVKKVSDEQASTLDFFKETWITGSIYSDTGHGTMYQKAVEPNVDADGYSVLYKIHGLGEDGLGFRYMTGPKKESAKFGKMFAKIPIVKREALSTGDYAKPMPIVNYYDISPDVGNIRHEGAVTFNKGKKPEKMIAMLLNYFSNPGDIVLDYHLGSGTTAAVAHKMGRQYVGVEQLYYGDNDPIVRLKNVIDGDQTGISKISEWESGGSFVYCNIMNNANKFRERIENTKSEVDYTKLLKEATASSFLSYRIDPKKLNEDEFRRLSAAEKRHLLLELIDNNTLYVNYQDINDPIFKVSDKDKELNKKLYEEK